MTSIPTANQLAGRAIGSIFLSCFGALWIATALYIRQSLSIAGICADLGVTAILLACAIRLIRQSRNFVRVLEDPAQTRAFHRINAIQWIAIGIVAFTLGRLHQEVYGISAITTIVGLHLFPLARLFRYPAHYVTAIALVLWAGISLLISPLDRLQSTTALGTGILLWLSAATTLSLAARRIRSARDASPIRLELHA
jgi:hypothetical protein